MKIAFIRYEYDPYGGAERFTQSVMDSLSKQGHEIHIYARNWIRSENTNIYFHDIKGPGSPSLLRHMWFVYYLKKTIRKDEYNLIQSNERTLSQHIYRAGDGVHAKWLELRACHQNVLRRFSILINPFHHFMMWLERKMFEDKELKAVIVNSNMVRREITDRFKIEDSRIHTIYNGVDLDKFHPDNRKTMGTKLRIENNVPDNVPVVLFAGSGFERKGLSFLIQGLARREEDFRLWVVGKGKTGRFRKLAKSLGIGSRIVFFGPQKHIQNFYAGSDIFAFPTIYDPFSSVVLEAMATGLPVITTAQNGAAEIIEDGQSGFIIETPDAVEKLSYYLGRLFKIDERKKMGKNARAAATGYSMDSTVNKMKELYDCFMNEV